MVSVPKYLPILTMVALIVVLIYRVFDLGVTLDYLEGDLQDERRAVRVLKEFNRLPCDVLNDEVRKKHGVFEKGGVIFIEGFGFSCELDASGKKVLNFVD